MKIQNTLIDNSTEQLSMSTILKNCILSEGLTSMKIATGYWDIPGLALIVDELAQFFDHEDTKLQLLIGREPLVYANVVTKPTINGDFPNDFMQKDLAELDVKDEYKKVVDLLLTNLQNGKWEIRYYHTDADGNEQFLHSKCYIFNGKQDNDKFAYGIVGSSNLTENGLNNQSRQKGNLELNYIEIDKQKVNFNDPEDPNCLGHNKWFDEIWEQAEPWNEKYLEQVLKPSKIAIEVEMEKENANKPLTPYEAYIRLLHDKFGILADVDVKTVLKTYLPKEINMYEYQLDAVAWCYQIMHEHGGFMLGDVVGLGKTIVGILLVKFYLEYAENEHRDKKVLIIVPPAIKSSWINTIEVFDHDREDKIQPSIDFVTTGSIDKTLEEDEENAGEFDGELKQEMYGLIMIDESHNFRNNGTQMYEALDELISKIGAQKGYYPYIGLLSATPQNNSPMDLRNQIFLFQRMPRESSINVEGRNLEIYFANAQKKYEQIIRQHPTTQEQKQANREKLRALMKDIHDNVLAEILVRRTRADIRDGYHEDIHFPEVIGPETLKYHLGYKLAKLFNDTMDIIAPSEEIKEQMQADEYLHYVRYSATKYLATEELKKPYKGRNMSPERSSEALGRIMQILLVKRLESSFSAFKTSLHNLQRYTENMITMWEKDVIFICPQIDVNAELDLKKKQEKYGTTYTFEDCFEDIRKKIARLEAKKRNEKKQNAEYRRADFLPEYITLLRQDKALIDELVARWDTELRDPKLDEFKLSLRKVLFDKSKNIPQKLVIFSEAVDTVEELADIADEQGFSPLLITAANRTEKEQTICENFDANYKGEWKNDFDIIITTEVLAEGVNLHRANTILNYDTPWNSTRLIQRIGRVNRIGSTSANVYVYNFYPSDEGDQEINLVQRAFTKLQSFHTLFGEDSKVFSDEEELEKINYKQMLNETLSEYTPYMLELQEYKRKNALRLEQIKQAESPVAIQFAGAEKHTAVVVKTEGNPISNYFIIDEDGNGQKTSCLEVLKIAKCAPDTTAIEFEEFDAIRNTAIRAYNVHRSKLFRASGNGAHIFDDAKQIIRGWITDPNLSKETKNTLNVASRLVGNHDRSVAKKIILLAEQMTDTSRLFATISIDEFIQNELKNLHASQAEREGEPYIYLATKII